jgi:MOSC domain-containing protein YiiM
MIQDLLKSLPQTGRVNWIGIASEPRAPIRPVDEVIAEVGHGLTEDHHAKRRKGGKRQVTLIQAEHLDAVASLCGRDAIQPELLRRNIAVSGINLLALKNRRFQIGEVLLEYSGPCEPCSRMEENLGPGGYNAMRGHGGITTRVITGGAIRIGDTVRVADDPDPVPPDGPTSA